MHIITRPDPDMPSIFFPARAVLMSLLNSSADSVWSWWRSFRSFVAEPYRPRDARGPQMGSHRLTGSSGGFLPRYSCRPYYSCGSLRIVIISLPILAA